MQQKFVLHQIEYLATPYPSEYNPGILESTDCPKTNCISLMHLADVSKISDIFIHLLKHTVILWIEEDLEVYKRHIASFCAEHQYRKLVDNNTLDAWQSYWSDFFGTTNISGNYRGKVFIKIDKDLTTSRITEIIQHIIQYLPQEIRTLLLSDINSSNYTKVHNQNYIKHTVKTLGMYPIDIKYQNTLVIVASMPKSGTYSLARCLHKSNLNFEFEDICATYSSGYLDVGRQLLDEKKINILLESASANTIFALVTHLSPDLHNEYIIKKYLHAKIVVQIRDVRQVVLSMYHYTFGNKNQSNKIRLVDLTDPIHQERFDAWMKKTLPMYCKWLAGWLELEKRGVICIKFLEFKTWKTDLQGRIKSITEFYGLIDDSDYTKDFIIGNYRKGQLEEFMQTYTLEQLQYCHEIVPKHWLERFGWPTIPSRLLVPRNTNEVSDNLSSLALSTKMKMSI